MKLYYAKTPHGRKACAIAAYLGIDLDYEVVGESMLMVSASGTAVTIAAG